MKPPGDVVLTTEELRVGYGSYVVLHDVNFTAFAGQIVTLVGLNGAGKSSFLKTLMGTIPAIGGRIDLLGADVTNWPTFRRVGAGIAFSPEGRRVFPNMTVSGNLLLGAAALPRAQERSHLTRVLALFPELSGRLEQRAGTLSGGEQQMLAIGRALMAGPRLLLVEEPSQGLAPVVVDRVYEALVGVLSEGVAVVVAEQFQQVREDVSDRILVIDGGTVTEYRESGPGANLIGRQI
ncbi:MAG TPA: ABC transporter ATP-binding protein [Sporichthyaceae bacterium]|nr:ABC transporter ATP-binding protein [Sporichthyaceae bacterium]